jgi:hypothetical protein
MRFVMIPVPSEHVREVIDIVLFSSPDTERKPIRDEARVRTLVRESDPVTRALLRTVAEAAVAGTEVTVADVAAAIGEEEANVLGIVRDLGVRALQRLVVLRTPERRRISGTNDDTLSMEPRRAELVLTALRDLPAQ